ncbi:L-threonylcarbamoyladenylate synthase [Magnetococcus sp. PR-3]|uniref:L-threonylcarbamoyladenylate synthase n=1 Tax=Magnetococcus sp. PR-3 TaxID=3120355 RepID=UPI002FCE5A06
MADTAHLYADEQLQQAVLTLAAGGVIAYPTETLYGLGVDPFNAEALRALITLKGRAEHKGLILLLPDPSFLSGLVGGITPVTQRLMDAFWPGPLTLVLPAQPHLDPLITGGTGMVAVRHSPSPYVQALLNKWRQPLVSSSANVSGSEASHWSPEQIMQHWQGRLGVVLPGPFDLQAKPSTVIRVDQEQVTLLRPGAIRQEQLAQITPIVDH